MEMVCRFVVAEFDCARTVTGKVIEPPPPPPLVEPPQDTKAVAAAVSRSINASGRAKGIAL
jgi:hypothetical protein